jgi:hypothetical protein
MVSLAIARVLARCNGFEVTAGGDPVGAVATPVFSGTKLVPDYLLVRLDATIPGSYRAITADLIETADAASETVELGITVGEVAALPEPRFVHLHSL